MINAYLEPLELHECSCCGEVFERDDEYTICNTCRDEGDFYDTLVDLKLNEWE